MPRYMMFIKHTSDYFGKQPSAELMQAMGTFVGGHAEAGRLVDAGGLMSTRRGKKVRLHGGKVQVIDGPFTESKEIIGGYALMDLPSEEEAMQVAMEFMTLHQKYEPDFDGECELRPLQTGMPGSE